MNALKSLVVLVAGMTAASIALAWKEPTVEYSADSYMETSAGVMAGKVNHSRGKERREYSEGGMNMVMILRHDKKRVWMLMPDQKMFMDMEIDKDRADNLAGYTIQETRVGEETVNGVKTTKYKTIMTSPKGHTLDGFYWVTKDNVVMKMDAVSSDKRRQERIKIELKNLKVGPQSAALFEVPKGYSSGIGGMLGSMMKDDADEKQVAEDKPTATGEEKKDGFGWQDALKLIR